MKRLNFQKRLNILVFYYLKLQSSCSCFFTAIFQTFLLPVL